MSSLWVLPHVFDLILMCKVDWNGMLGCVVHGFPACNLILHYEYGFECNYGGEFLLYMSRIIGKFFSSDRIAIPLVIVPKRRRFLTGLQSHG